MRKYWMHNLISEQQNSLNSSVTVNSTREYIFYNDKNRHFDIKQVNAEDCILRLLPVLLDFTDVVERNKMIDLRLWHYGIITLYMSYKLGGVISKNDYNILMMLKNNLANEEHFLYVIATQFRLTNFDLKFESKLLEIDQMNTANSKLNILRNNFFLACLSNVTGYDDKNNHIKLDSIENIKYLLPTEEIAYRLCYKSLKVIFGSFLKTMMDHIKIEDRKSTRLNSSH